MLAKASLDSINQAVQAERWRIGRTGGHFHTLDRPWAKEIPIVAITANVFKEDVDKCPDAGLA